MKTLPLLVLVLLLAPQSTPNDLTANLAYACIEATGLPVWDATADNGIGAWQFSDDCRAIYGAAQSLPRASETPRNEAGLAMYRHAQYIVSGALPSACAEVPEGWVTSQEAIPASTHVVSCGNTVLTFYSHGKRS